MLVFKLVRYAIENRRHLHYSRDQIRRMQQQKFLRLVRTISQKSLYYQRIIKEHKIDIINCTPEDFPILTKTDVMEHFDEMVTDRRITKAKVAQFLDTSHDSSELFLNRYYVIHTSGSSGAMGYYVYSEDALAKGVVHFTRFNKMRLFQKYAYVAAVKGHFAGVTMANTGSHLPFLYQEVRKLDINQPFQQIIDALNTMQPNSLGGYAFALRKLAEAQRNGRLSIAPTIVQSAGEPLSQQDKDTIQNLFHAPVVNVYGTSEHLMMGIGMDDFDGMYLMEDDLIFEIHPNYTYVTNLFNDTLPLIRYRMSDILQPVADKNQVMPFTKVANLVGRNEAIPTFMNNRGEEDFISPIILVEFYVPHIKQFQFHITNKSHFTFKACLEDGLQQEETELTLQKITARLRNILDEKLMTNVTFTVELVDHLDVDAKTGKFRLIVLPGSSVPG